jgi:hypothetical protein
MSALRVVRTVAEFDALPDGTVLLDGEDVAVQKLDEEAWVAAASCGRFTSAELLAAFDEFRVIWEPEAGSR